MTTASTPPRGAGSVLLDVATVILGDPRQPPCAFPIARRHPRELQAVRNPAQWTRYGHLGHRHPTPAGDIGQRQGDASLRRRAHLRQENESFAVRTTFDDSLVVD